jgi:hypothetical protein
MTVASLRTGCLAAAALALSGCAASVERQRMEMSPRQIGEAGLVCRTDRSADTNIPRSVCASPETWAAYDARQDFDNEQLFDRFRSTDNRVLYPR